MPWYVTYYFVPTDIVLSLAYKVLSLTHSVKCYLLTNAKLCPPPHPITEMWQSQNLATASGWCTFTVSSPVPQIPCSFQPQVRTELESKNITMKHVNTKDKDRTLLVTNVVIKKLFTMFQEHRKPEQKCDITKVKGYVDILNLNKMTQSAGSLKTIFLRNKNTNNETTSEK